MKNMELYLNLIIIYIISILGGENNCSSVFKPFDGNSNHGLSGITFGLFLFETLEDCATTCLRVTDCVLVTYERQTRFCHFWVDYQLVIVGDNEAQNTVIVDMEDWKQVMKNDPCSNQPCNGGQRCVPNRLSYICEDFCTCCNVPYFMNPGTFYNVSSVDSSTHTEELKLTSPGGWLPDSTDQNPHILVNFSEVPFIIKGVITRGDERRKSWVSGYTILTSTDRKTFTALQMSGGNEDAENSVINYISPAIAPKYLKIQIEAYENVPSFRMDLVGCFA